MKEKNNNEFIDGSNSIAKQRTKNFKTATTQMCMWLFAFLICFSMLLIIQPNLNKESDNILIAAGTAPSGSGTSSSPYIISSANNLRYISTTSSYSTYWGSSSSVKYYKLTANITLDDTTWSTIGTSSNNFYGYVDGQNYTITFTSDVTFQENYMARAGLFDYAQNSTFLNLNVNWKEKLCAYTTAGSVTSTYLGGIVASATNCTFNNCSTRGRLASDNGAETGSIYAGGLVGESNGCTFVECFNYSTNSSTAWQGSDLGGIVGIAKNSTTFNRCYNAGEILTKVGFSYSSKTNVGGILGYGDSTITIKNCYNSGAVIGKYENQNLIYTAYIADVYAGGIVGFLATGGTSSVINCYNNALVFGYTQEYNEVTTYVGGISASGGSLYNCYSVNNEVSGDGMAVCVAGICGINATIYNCYYDSAIYTTGKTNSATMDGTKIPTLSQKVKELSTFWNGSSGVTSFQVDSQSYSWNSTYPWDFYNASTNSDGIWKLDSANCGFMTFEGQDEPETISTAEEFMEIVNDSSKWAGNYLLTSNITISQQAPVSIGNESIPFSGTFDGNGYTITADFKATITSTYVGIFAYVKGGRIYNLGVNWQNELTHQGSSNIYVGGICGYLHSGTIARCSSSGFISGQSSSTAYVGGIAGGFSVGAIYDCYNLATVSCTSSGYAGGIVSQSNTVGFVGNCYNAGNISGTNSSGICTISGYDIPHNSYYLSTATADTYAISLTSEQMQNAVNMPAFNFDSVWIVTKSTPILQIQSKYCDLTLVCTNLTNQRYIIEIVKDGKILYQVSSIESFTIELEGGNYEIIFVYGYMGNFTADYGTIDRNKLIVSLTSDTTINYTLSIPLLNGIII